MTDTIEDTTRPSWLQLPTIVAPSSPTPATPTLTTIEEEMFDDAFTAPARFDTGPTAVIPTEPRAAFWTAANSNDQATAPVETIASIEQVAADEADEPVTVEPEQAVVVAPEEDAAVEPGLPSATMPETRPKRFWRRALKRSTSGASAEIEPEDADEPEAVPISGKATATAEELIAAASEYEVVRKIKKFPLIDPDQRWVMFAAISALGGILAANLGSSFTAVYAMAATVGLPLGFQWLPVVILDVAIVGFSWVLMVFMSRGYEVKRTRFYLITVTTFSVVANFMHTFEHWHGDLTTAPAVYGVVFSSSIPLMALAATEELIRLVFIRRKRVTKKKKDINA